MIQHWLGFDGSWTTDAWGGFVSCLGMFAAMAAFMRHHNCHVRWCPRLGRHKVEGTEYSTCRRHHPEGHRTVEDVHRAWLKATHTHRLLSDVKKQRENRSVN